MLDKIEKRHIQDRYVKKNMGLWSGREVMSWYWRILLAPAFSIQMFFYCVWGTPVNLQILHDADHEPEHKSNRVICPQCRNPDPRQFEIQFKIGEAEDED